MNTATIEIHKADSEASETREQRYAYGEKGGSVALTVSRKHRPGAICHCVSWNANDGRGWRGGGYSASFRTESDAQNFVAEKWATLVAWLEDLEPINRAFSPDFTCHMGARS